MTWKVILNPLTLGEPVNVRIVCILRLKIIHSLVPLNAHCKLMFLKLGDSIWFLIILLTMITTIHQHAIINACNINHALYKFCHRGTYILYNNYGHWLMDKHWYLH